MKLSIIILNYNVRYFLELCIQSVEAATKNIVHEIIVVDNNSSDLSCAMVSEKFPDIKLICNRENVGFAKANNQGVKFAQGEYVLILNPDTILAEDTLEKVIAFADKQSNLGALGVRMIDGNGKFLPESKRNVPTVKVANQKLRGITKNYYAVQFGDTDIAKVAILTGAFLLMKRQLFIKIGGFDEDYFMYGEDVDLSYKLLNKGYDNYYFGKTTIVHFKGESTKKDNTYLKHFYGAMQLFYEKHFQVNSFLKFISNFGFKLLIFYKSWKIKEKPNESNKISKCIYFGNNFDNFERIQKTKQADFYEMCAIIPMKIDFQKMIFDAKLITFQEIIKTLQKEELLVISKRIIPKNCTYYIGSDDSFIRGEVEEF